MADGGEERGADPVDLGEVAGVCGLVVGYTLVALVGLAATLATGSWWRSADQAR